MCLLVHRAGKRISRRAKMEQRVNTTSPSSLVPPFCFSSHGIYATLVRCVLSYRIILYIFLHSHSHSILVLRLYLAWTPPFSVLYFEPCGRKDYYSFVSWTLVGLLLYCHLFFFCGKSLFCTPRARCRIVGCGMAWMVGLRMSGVFSLT